MYLIVKSFFNLTMLRLAPQQLPASGFLLGLVMMLFLAVEMVGYHVTKLGWRLSLVVTIVDIVLVVLFAKAMLDFTSRRNRFIQTLTALFGAGVVIQSLSIPFVAMYFQGVAEQNLQFAKFALLTWLFMVGWQILAFAHVFRHALDIKLGWAVILVLSFELLSGFVILPLLFPAAGGAG